MQKLNSYELFVNNPKIHTSFPFLCYDCNNRKTVPPRSRFQQIHWHEDIQITYVLEGVLKIVSLDHIVIVHKGEAVFINKRVLHQFIEIDTAHYRSFIFPIDMITFYDHSPMEKDISEISLSVFLIKDKNMLEIIHKINQASFEIYKGNHKEYYLMTLLVQFIYEILLESDHEINHEIEYHQQLQECIVFIHQHYNEDLSLEDIASYGNISVGYCGRLFSQTLDTTPYEYLINYRINKSIELLNNKQKTITQIALEVGFNDVSHFIQVFKKKMNITPKQYQKQLFKKSDASL